MDVQLFAGQLEVTADSEEVTREDGGVRIRLTMPFGLTPGTPYRATLAEPVSVKAGEHITIEVLYAAPGWTGTCEQPPTVLSGAGTVSAVFSW